ncbi:MAG: hypothetical protein PVJ21_11205 [Anaerolineales bacterium]|jgi:uncharacterized membrane protein
MDILMIVLRLLHIISGVLWVGAGVIMFFFIGPTLGATADAGQKFAQHLMTQTRFTAVVTVSAILTVLAGASLYWIDSGGLTSAWMHSGAGLGFGIGAFFGLIGFVFGLLVGNINGALAKLGMQLQGKPTPEQMAQIGALRKRLSVVSPINAYSLIIATLLMAIARYLRF